MKSNQHIVNKIHLVISVLIVVPVAFIYGFNLESLLDLYPETIDEKNFNKAIMGLYLSFSLFWVLGISRKTFLMHAIISNIIFMLGLALGRILSVGLDGVPTSGYLYGLIGELFLGIYGLFILNKLRHDPAS